MRNSQSPAGILAHPGLNHCATLDFRPAPLRIPAGSRVRNWAVAALDHNHSDADASVTAITCLLVAKADTGQRPDHQHPSG